MVFISFSRVAKLSERGKGGSGRKLGREVAARE